MERGALGLVLTAVPGTSGRAAYWGSVRVTWRPCCARPAKLGTSSGAVARGEEEGRRATGRGTTTSNPRVADRLKSRRKEMRALGYVTAITMAAALGVLAVRSLPDLRLYAALRKM